MGLKKYEIITVGSDKRVRALRSWQVGDRYVNIGDVGGIVYDEKTLSQDGACWLFRGNFGFPGARIGGDSIVDVGEAALSTTGAPAVDILGSSVVVGGKLSFVSDETAADALVLGAADFEQGGMTWVSAGASYESMKTSSGVFLRSKNPIFLGGVGVTLKCDVPGYTVAWYVFDRDMNAIIASSAVTNTKEGVTVAVPAGQYMIIGLGKNPSGPLVPADATAARIKFTGTYDTKLVMVDSRLEVNPATSAGIVTIRPGGTHPVVSGAKYPDSVIADSKVAINATSNRGVRFMSDFSNVNATIDATAADAQAVGTYRNVNNLVFSGTFTGALGQSIPQMIQAYDCDNMVVTAANFPGFSEVVNAGVPFIFQGCNVPGGIFYHHARIANTYKNIDFAKAQADLGKGFSSGIRLVSSEIEGMYRSYTAINSAYGMLVEAHDSVKSTTLSSATITDVAPMYGTTIYADAYLDGLFNFAGTNVFGNKVRSHPLAQVLNVQPRAVQGKLTLKVGQRPTLVPGSLARVVIDRPIRINTANGITVSNIPAGIQAAFACVDGQGNYVVISTWKEGTATVTNLAQLALPAAYLMFKKANDIPITPEDLAGVTVTTYNGCKIVNTGKTLANMKGNIRVEDNATLVNVSVTGSGYFGGNSIIQAPSALVGQLPIEGAAYMSDNAVFAPSAANASAEISLLEMKDNAVFAGNLTGASTNYNITMADNAQFLGAHGSRSGFVMRGNSFVAAAGTVASACSGLLTMKDDARIENGSLTAIGHITLCGKYKQTASKAWTGKRTITDVNEPGYDNNVKTQYDF